MLICKDTRLVTCFVLWLFCSQSVSGAVMRYLVGFDNLGIKYCMAIPYQVLKLMRELVLAPWFIIKVFVTGTFDTCAVMEVESFLPC